MGQDAHGFDRRVSDVNVAAIGTRMGALETRVEVLEKEHKTMNLELRANTELTRQTHSKVEAVHDVLDAAKGGFRLLEGAAKIVKPLLWLMIFVGAVWGYVTTGQWPRP